MSRKPFLFRRMSAALIVTAALAGCATPVPRPSFPDIRGMPIAAVTERIGLPDDSFYVDDRKVYVWRREVERRRPRFHPPGYYGWTAYPYSDYVTRRCTLKLTVDDAERVTSWERDGHISLCDRYARDLGGPRAPS